MGFKVFVDGQEGTTGLKIRDHLSTRKDIKLVEIEPEKRKDTSRRRELLNEADIVFLCLPDAAAKESAAMVSNVKTKIIDPSTIAKPAVENIVIEFWIAHEKILTKQAEGWTWERFCDEAGYNRHTPIKWFEKYGMQITRVTHREEGAKVPTPIPPKKHTNPEVKKQLQAVAQLRGCSTARL